MLHSLSRTRAWTLAVLVLAACAWIVLHPAKSSIVGASKPAYTDIRLYQDVAAQVASGANYYTAATTLHRAHGFPTKPFVTVREPTLALLAARLGWPHLQIALFAVVIAAALAWFGQADRCAPGERAALALAVLAGGLSASDLGLVTLHELWAGALIALAIALRGGRLWWLAVLAGGAAIALRELAVPFVVLALAMAAIERRRREVFAWLAVLALFALGMAFHAHAVEAARLPGDLASPGWNGLRGPVAPLRDLVDVSLLTLLPAPVALIAALLALLGWAAAPLHQRNLALLFLIGIAAMIALFARSQNFYWVFMTLPTWFIGLAFVPRALRDLAQAMLARTPAAL